MRPRLPTAIETGTRAKRTSGRVVNVSSTTSRAPGGIASPMRRCRDAGSIGTSIPSTVALPPRVERVAGHELRGLGRPGRDSRHDPPVVMDERNRDLRAGLLDDLDERGDPSSHGHPDLADVVQAIETPAGGLVVPPTIARTTPASRSRSRAARGAGPGDLASTGPGLDRRVVEGGEPVEVPGQLDRVVIPGVEPGRTASGRSAGAPRPSPMIRPDRPTSRRRCGR